MAEMLALVAVLVIVVAIKLRDNFISFLSHDVRYYNTLSIQRKVCYNHKHGRRRASSETQRERRGRDA